MPLSLEALASDIRMVDNSYTSYKARNYLSFHSADLRILDRIDPAGSVLSTALIFVLAFTAVFLRHFFRKEDRKA